MSAFWDSIQPYVVAIAPTIGVAFLFYLVIKGMIEADRRERRSVAQWEAEHGRSIRPKRGRPDENVQQGALESSVAQISPENSVGAQQVSDESASHLPRRTDR